MTIINLASLLAAGISLVTNFRQLVNSLSKVQAPSAEEPIVTLPYSRVKGHDFILSAKPDTCLQGADVGTCPRLIDSTGACSGLALLDRPSGKPGVGAAFKPPKPSITVQRLSCTTPSPPRFIRWMLTRGGGRFRPIDICRPGWQRLMVQYAEGCDITDNDETGEPWSPCLAPNTLLVPSVSVSNWLGETDIVDELGLNLVSRRSHMKHTFDSDFSPEHLQKFERLVANRIRAGRLDTMDPLKRAVHNSLARVVDLTVTRRAPKEPKRPRNHTRSSSNTSSFKLDDGQCLRRTRPTVRPLDLDAARAFHPPTDSPPESPGPTTPVDSAFVSAGVEVCIAGDETVPGEPMLKGGVRRTPSRGRSIARSRHRS